MPNSLLNAYLQTIPNHISPSTPFQITGRAIRDLATPAMITDITLNATLELILSSHLSPTVQWLTTDIFHIIAFQPSGYDRSALGRISHRVTISGPGCQLTLIPISRHSHFVLAVIDHIRHRINGYDSLHGDPHYDAEMANHISTIHRLLIEEATSNQSPPIPWIEVPNAAQLEGLPRQDNGVDCGRYVALIAYCITRSSPIPLKLLTPTIVAQARSTLAHSLLHADLSDSHIILSPAAPSTTSTDSDPPDSDKRQRKTACAELPMTNRKRRGDDTILQEPSLPTKRSRPAPGYYNDENAIIRDIPIPTPPELILSHGLTDPHRHKFYVAQSVDPDAGWGLFAKRQLAVDTVLCEYTGRKNPPNPSAGYTYKHPNLEHSIDAYDPLMLLVLCLAGYVNDPLDESRENARFEVRNGRLYLIATRTIRPDEQIFAHYGDGYWTSLVDRWSLPLLVQIVERYLPVINLTAPEWQSTPHSPTLWRYLYGDIPFPTSGLTLDQLPSRVRHRTLPQQQSQGSQDFEPIHAATTSPIPVAHLPAATYPVFNMPGARTHFSSLDQEINGSLHPNGDAHDDDGNLPPQDSDDLEPTDTSTTTSLPIDPIQHEDVYPIFHMTRTRRHRASLIDPTACDYAHPPEDPHDDAGAASDAQVLSTEPGHNYIDSPVIDFSAYDLPAISAHPVITLDITRPVHEAVGTTAVQDPNQNLPQGSVTGPNRISRKVTFDKHLYIS